MKQILIFVLLSAMLCWFMFAPVYKHVLIMRQAVLQQEVDLLLEWGANGEHGYIDGLMVEASRQRLAARGFDPAKLVYLISTDSGADGTNPEHPVLRGDGLRLEIRYPYESLFDIDRLAGIAIPEAGTHMSSAGLKMSEYVP